MGRGAGGKGGDKTGSGDRGGGERVGEFGKIGEGIDFVR